MPNQRSLAALALLAAAAANPVAAASLDRGDALPAIVEGTSLVVLAPNGRRAAGRDLVGAVVVGSDTAGGNDAFRIDAVITDPADPEIQLYTLSIRDAQSGGWRPYCVPDERGVAGGFFLSGSWDKHSTHLHDNRFSVTCTSGVIGKCVRWGYKPWKTAADGRPMWDYHQACTRLVRADYCGDGQTHTRNGVPIEIVDRIGATEEAGNALVFEAAWTSDGADCVARPRLSRWELKSIEAACPARLKDRVGAAARCNVANSLGNPSVLLINKSPPDTP